MSTQGPVNCVEDVTVKACGVIHRDYLYGEWIGVKCSCGAKATRDDRDHNEQWEIRRDQFIRQHARERE